MNTQSGSNPKTRLSSAPITFTDFKNFWAISSYLGGGLYANALSIVHRNSNDLLAVKIEIQSMDSSYNECIRGTLEREYHMYRCIHEKLSNHDSVAIPQVYSLIKDEDHPDIMTMDLLGTSLKNLLDWSDGGFSLKTVLQIGDQVLQTLSLLHSAGICHGDIHSGNIVIGRNETSETFYLVDFGAARDLCAAKQQPIVESGQVNEDNEERPAEEQSAAEPSDEEQSGDYSFDDQPELSKERRLRKTDLDRLLRMLDDILADKERKDCESAQQFGRFCREYVELGATNEAVDIDYMRGMFHQWFEHEGLVRDGNFEWKSDS